MTLHRRIACGLVALAALAGCTTTRTGEAPATIRICDTSGCSDRDPSTATFVPEETRQSAPLPASARQAGKNPQSLRAAAEQGNPAAAHHLALSYLHGKGVPADPAMAARWFTVAAEGGVSDAQYNLGLMLYRGQGGEMNLYQALQWMRRAAEGGYLPAQTAVGRLYLTGLDTMGQDLQEAETWLIMAAGRGDATAKSLLATLQNQRKSDEEFRRNLLLLQAETARAWANAALASWLTAPRFDYIVVW